MRVHFEGNWSACKEKELAEINGFKIVLKAFYKILKEMKLNGWQGGKTMYNSRPKLGRTGFRSW